MTKHFTTETLNGKAACGAKGCDISTSYSTYFVECSRCAKSSAYKAAIKADYDKPEAVVKAVR